MERTKLLTVAVIGLLLLNLLTIGYLVLRPAGRRGPGQNGPPGGGEPSTVIIERLQFDSLQQQQYAQLINAHQDQTRALSRQSVELFRAYYGLLEADQPDTARANLLSQQIAQNQREQAQLNFAHFEEIKRLCRPDQQAAFNRLVSELSRLFGRQQRPARPGPVRADRRALLTGRQVQTWMARRYVGWKAHLKMPLSSRRNSFITSSKSEITTTMTRIQLTTAISGLALTAGLLTFMACKQSTDAVTPSTSGTTSTSTTVGTGVPAVYQKIYGATDIYVEGTNIVIKTKGRPDHKSPYYQGTQWESTLYEAYNGTNTKYAVNPNRISEFTLTFKIPMNPAVDAAHAETPLGAIGVALNGVAFFNQYAAQRAVLTNEINGFDQYAGHPQQQGQYHYHVEPTYLTKAKGKDALLGFLLDGFPVYGPTENGKTITNTDLDKYHGHTSVTADYPNGIYHYHITAEDPYLNGSGFYGKAGTITQ